MAAGQMRARVVFERATTAPDGAGGKSVSWGEIWACRGKFMPERGRERLAAGRVEASLAGVLRVRSCIAARDVSEANRVQIDDVVFQIRSISNPDQRNKFLEMSVERGAGT